MNGRFKYAVAALALLLGGCSAMPMHQEAAYAPTPPPAPVPSAQNGGAIYQAGYDVALFQDVKARHVGDIITIVLVEKTNASKSASTNASKETSTDISGPTVFGRPVTHNGTEILSANLESSQDFEGKGDSSQSNSLTGNISVTVAEVLPNGNLVVRGQKRLTLNQGDEYVQVAGIVRPVDVRGDNTVLSTQLADARITYSGRGAVADANAMGWLSRFFFTALWPF